MRPEPPSAPRVSVVMAVRDGDRWLAEAVESLLGQSERAFECIVVDDGSEDRTPVLLDALRRRDGRLRVLRQPRLGLCAALNRGLAEARGPLVARLGADDVAHESRLERQVAAFAARPELGVLGTWAQEIDARGRPLGLR